MACSNCFSGVGKSLGKFVPGNQIPAWIEARRRSQGRTFTPIQLDRARIDYMRGLGDLPDPLGGALGMPLIAGVPNIYLAAGALLLIVMMKR